MNGGLRMKVNTYIKIILLLGSFLCVQPADAWPKFGKVQEQEVPEEIEKSNSGILSGLSSMIGIGINDAGGINIGWFSLIATGVIIGTTIWNAKHKKPHKVRGFFDEYLGGIEGVLRTGGLLYFAWLLCSGGLQDIIKIEVLNKYRITKIVLPAFFCHWFYKDHIVTGFLNCIKRFRTLAEGTTVGQAWDDAKNDADEKLG